MQSSTERNLDLASTQNRIAEEKARELKSEPHDHFPDTTD